MAVDAAALYEQTHDRATHRFRVPSAWPTMIEHCSAASDSSATTGTKATIAVVAYKQEQYIEEAIRGALSQTYSPLQIILSDDGSPDRTFEIMQTIAAQYEGPHQLLLNRNDRNLGLADHLNRVVELSESDIVVLAAGDDVSLPDRVARIVKEFSRSPDVRAVYSGYTSMSPSGEVEGAMVLPAHVGLYTDLVVVAKSGGWVGLGATFAYHRDCFDKIGPIPREIICEDGLLPFRAALLGTIGYVREPLVLYRKLPTSLRAIAKFDTAAYEDIHCSVLRRELDWALKVGLLSLEVYTRSQRALSGWPAFAARARLLRLRPLLTRLHHAFYYSDVIRRRVLQRLGALRNSSGSAATKHNRLVS